ncbi:MAG TPA: hypothetical protein VKY19_03295 [Ktedonosporobacter sp.]|jgi:hypothetical protein|nr:hypothetical protein [Ktedonosporobacter sp.]
MSVRFQHNVARFAIVVAFALMLAFMASNLGVSRAYAASATTAVTTHTQIPAIGLFWRLNNGNTQRAGTSFQFTLQWNSGQTLSTGFTAYWGDGNSDNYTCWLNCGSGTTNFSHFYTFDGTYSTHGDSSLGGPSNSITVFVKG